MTRTQKINKIVEAALSLNFSENIEDIEMLSYTGENGRVYEDRFDCIDTTTIPCTVRFIGGTGYPNFSMALTSLTDESLDTLCGCVLRKNAKK
jgi:hypothetical protein